MESVTTRTIPGGWSQQNLTIGDYQFNLVLPHDPDAFLDDLAARPVSEQDEDVYWAKLWQAAPPTAKAILERDWAAGQRCLEIGCGLGLVGVAALAKGLEVTFSDYVQVAVDTALENARRNGFSNVSGRIVDWREPPDETYPVIVGCDILYFEQMHVPLANTLDRMLAPGGTCWIGDAGRFHSGKFIHVVSDRGYRVKLLDENGSPLLRPTHGRFQLVIVEKPS